MKNDPPNVIKIGAFSISCIFWARIQARKPFPSKFGLIKSLLGSVLIENKWENAKNAHISLLGGVFFIGHTVQCDHV